MPEIKGIDVSENNGILDFQAIAREGIEFVIVRSSYGQTGRDELFQRNVEAAHAAGLRCGAYHYDYSLDIDDAIANAVNCREAIAESGVLLEMPVFYDLEDADGWKRDRGFDTSDGVLLTNMCEAFLGEIRLNAGIYASYSWLEIIDWKSLDCPVWNAQWIIGANPAPDTRHDDLKVYLWQYTDSLEVAGYTLDGDIWYKP